jgi:hypothetical protein
MTWPLLDGAQALSFPRYDGLMPFASFPSMRKRMQFDRINYIPDSDNSTESPARGDHTLDLHLTESTHII